MGGKVLGGLNGTPDENDQHTRCQGVESTGVSHLAGVVKATHLAHHVVGGHPCGLVNQKNAARLGQFGHSNSFREKADALWRIGLNFQSKTSSKRRLGT